MLVTMRWDYVSQKEQGLVVLLNTVCFHEAFYCLELPRFYYSRALSSTASSCTDLENARFWIRSKNIWMHVFCTFLSIFLLQQFWHNHLQCELQFTLVEEVDINHEWKIQDTPTGKNFWFYKMLDVKGKYLPMLFSLIGLRCCGSINWKNNRRHYFSISYQNITWFKKWNRYFDSTWW